MHILHVVGARPNFMKAAPVLRALDGKPGVRQTLIHTGQHYDVSMSDVFFSQLELRAPDENLNVGSGSHAQQSAAIMSAFERVLLERKPDWIVVYGDVNSTVIAALTASKMDIKVAHVEAGLRSFDRAMPEEINRLVTDQLSDLLFTPSADGDANLLREGVAKEKIHLVGNVMIDTLDRILPKVASHLPKGIPQRYVLVTLHRPSNVDDLPWLQEMVKALQDIAKTVGVVFPIHPRTRQKLNSIGLDLSATGLHLLEPVPYMEFLALQQAATAVVTDSGGIQEETTRLGVPCLTMRDNTERPITITMGTNILVGRDIRKMHQELQSVLKGEVKKGGVPPLWDGHAAERIADIMVRQAGK